MKFRKKPIVIEAWEWPDYPKDAEITKMEPLVNYQMVKTLEGNFKRCKGDWLIKGIKGEFYPCKPDIFEATYRPVILPIRDVDKKKPFNMENN